MGIKGVKLCVIDFDSTLMQGETIEYLAKELSLEQRIKEITKLAMEGRIDFFESLIKRVKLLKGLKVKTVDEICSSLPLTVGAKELVDFLRKNSIITVCFSGGFENATKIAREKLRLDADFSNILHSKSSILTGCVGGDMMFSSSKGRMLQNLQKILKIGIEDTLCIGDGANDLSMFEYAKYRIAFCAKPIVRKASNFEVNEKDLSLVIDFFDL